MAASLPTTAMKASASWASAARRLDSSVTSASARRGGGASDGGSASRLPKADGSMSRIVTS